MGEEEVRRVVLDMVNPNFSSYPNSYALAVVDRKGRDRSSDIGLWHGDILR